MHTGGGPIIMYNANVTMIALRFDDSENAQFYIYGGTPNGVGGSGIGFSACAVCRMKLVSQVASTCGTRPQSALLQDTGRMGDSPGYLSRGIPHSD